MARAGCLVSVASLVVACGHAPPPAPAAEKPVGSFADLAGAWVRDDDMGWFYKLTLDGNGNLDQTIDRDQVGRCQQTGKLTAGDAPKRFKLALAKDTCTELGDAASTTVTVESFTGDKLVLVVGTARRAYHRAPEQ
jgi:hypothetical protein